VIIIYTYTQLSVCLYYHWVLLLQRVQNNLARVFSDVGWRHAHSADLLRDVTFIGYQYVIG